MPLVVMLDTQIYDLLTEDEEGLRALQTSVRAGQLDIKTTHVQEDELARIPDPDKKAKVASIPRQPVPTSDFVVGESRWGMARFGTGETVEAIRRDNLKHTRDALIAATAEYEGAVLVTEDKLLKRRAQGQGLLVWTKGELLTKLTRNSP